MSAGDLSGISGAVMTSPATWYHARLGARRPRPELEGRVAVRFAVVGGGLAGLATALSLAERGAEVALLEAVELGFGASGRNGGMASAGFTRPVDELLRRYGREHARALHAASREGLALLRRRIARYRIACDLVEGVVEASWFDDAEAMAREARMLNEEFGMRVECWPREKVRAIWRSARYYEAIFDPEGFHLDPLRLLFGYAEAAEARGVRIFECSPAERIRRRGAGFEIQTRKGRILAEAVILCPSVYGDPCDRRLARGLLAVASYVIVTEPLGERLARVIGAPYAVFDDRMATGYYRPLPEGRLLWGGRVSLFERRSREALERIMRRDLASVYPELAGVGVAYAWSGRMGFARHKMPVVRELEPGLWTATAFGGHGLNTTTMAGELVARALLEGDDRWRLFAPFALPWVGDGLGRLLAQGYYLFFALEDRIRAGWSSWRASSNRRAGPL